MRNFLVKGQYNPQFLEKEDFQGINFMYKIYDEPYIEDLLETIRSGGDIEVFLFRKNQQRKKDFEENDEKLKLYKKDYEEKEHELTKTKQMLSEIKIAKILQDKIKKVEENCFPEQKEDLRLVLNQYNEQGKFSGSEYEKLSANPKNILKKFLYLKKYEMIKSYVKDLTDFCQEQQLHKTDNIIIKNIMTLDTTYLQENYIEEQIKHFKEVQNTQISSKQSIEELCRKMRENFDNDERVEVENECIREFVKEKSEFILHPVDMSQEEITQNGLSEEYIEGQILQSRFPGKVRQALRNFYEGLNKPAAPLVPYRRKGFQDAIIKQLQARGYSAVKADDEKAKDPHNFVVDEQAVYAPFLEPKEALKANIAMVEIMADSDFCIYKSNPLTRESLVHALEINGKKTISVIENAQYNGCDYERICNNLEQVALEQGAYELLNTIGEAVRKENPELYIKIVSEGKRKFIGIEQAQYNQTAQEILENYKTELKPFTVQRGIEIMLQEALEKGEDSIKIFQTTMDFLEQNGYPKSVFHCGKNSDPYAVLYKEEEPNLGFVQCTGAVIGSLLSQENYPKIYQSVHSNGILGYDFGCSSNNCRVLDVLDDDYGFLMEYESRGQKQEFMFIGTPDTPWNGGKFNIEHLCEYQDETLILPYQNKLKKLYIAVKDAKQHNILYPLDLDEKGQVQDPRWKDFCDFHKAVNFNMSGFMVERCNNMITNYDEQSVTNIKFSNEEQTSKINSSEDEMIKTICKKRGTVGLPKKNKLENSSKKTASITESADDEKVGFCGLKLNK